MLKPKLEKPWRFDDGSFLETFVSERAGLQIYYNDQGVFAFGIDKILDEPNGVEMLSWHLDTGLSSSRAKKVFESDVGSVREIPKTDLVAFCRGLIEEEGEALDEEHRKLILRVLSR